MEYSILGSTSGNNTQSHIKTILGIWNIGTCRWTRVSVKFRQSRRGKAV